MGGSTVNVVFFGIIAIAFVVGAFTGTMEAVTKGAVDAAKSAVDLALGLVGVMTLFLGLMEVFQAAGALNAVTRLIRPLMVRLFPDVPPDHPAMGAMILNIAANAVGLTNAATPFGIRAMKELDKLNGEKGTATNAMALFLAINTSAVALLPTGVIGVRAVAGSKDAAGIFATTLFATTISTIGAVLVCKLLEKLPFYKRSQPPIVKDDGPVEKDEALANAVKGDGIGSLWPLLAVVAGLGVCVAITLKFGQAASAWIIPVLIFGFLAVGVVRKIKVYEVFIKGAKEGFQVALLIIPYLVAILVAVGMFRASGALDWLTNVVGTVTEPLGLPAKAVPMVFLRPLSGSGAFAYMSELLKTEGPDTYLGYLVSTMQGSSETTFYVLAVYFGSIQVHRTRHALPAGLSADLFGAAASVLVCKWFFSSL